MESLLFLHCIILFVLYIMKILLFTYFYVNLHTFFYSATIEQQQKSVTSHSGGSGNDPMVFKWILMISKFGIDCCGLFILF